MSGSQTNPDETPETASANAHPHHPSFSTGNSRYDRTPAYIFDIEDHPTNILVENGGLIRLASMLFL
jgi:hypothetical protein